jgi:hypothetical protein
MGINLVPLNLEGGVEKLPSWAFNEVLFRSGNGPSYIQRHMRKGEQDNLQRVAKILQQNPEALYAFDRKENEGAFDTAILLRKPNLLKLAVQALVDGNLGLNSDRILTSDIPQKALTTLEEMIDHYDPLLVVDILRDMAFVKVPFSKPMAIEAKDLQVSALLWMAIAPALQHTGTLKLTQPFVKGARERFLHESLDAERKDAQHFHGQGGALGVKRDFHANSGSFTSPWTRKNAVSFLLTDPCTSNGI